MGMDRPDIAIEDINPINPWLFSENTWQGYFERLRKEDPVHYCAESDFGPYWSVSSYDLIKEVDQRNDIFSSEPGITIFDQAEERAAFEAEVEKMMVDSLGPTLYRELLKKSEGS